MTTADKNLILSIPEALATTDRVCSSINVGSTKTGLNMDAVELMGRIVTETAQATKLIVTAMAVQNLLYFAMHQMITHLWQVLSMV